MEDQPMQYRSTSKIDDRLSLLGYGCMRFTRKAGRINQDKVEGELQRALDLGINYFDTAYIYPGSEEALGKFAAKNGNRERMLIASKMPHYTCKSLDDFDRIFAEELARLQTDYLDYYLIHMLTSYDSWRRCVDMGVCSWIEKKKASGEIRHIGFSYHGGREDFGRIVDDYDWDFVQIQLNYRDAHAQAGLEGLHHAAAKGLPVIVMEPLRGGKLADELPAGAKGAFRQANGARVQAGEKPLSLAAWAFRWLYDLPEVTCVLSGMNSIDQVEENCAVAAASKPGCLTGEDREVYERVIEEIRMAEKVPCTGCGYCLPCPRGIDIPTCFASYNVCSTEGWMTGFVNHVQYTALVKEPKDAGRCVSCGKCAQHCPQHIDIPAELANVKRTLEGPLYQIVKRCKGVFFHS